MTKEYLNYDQAFIEQIETGYWNNLDNPNTSGTFTDLDFFGFKTATTKTATTTDYIYLDFTDTSLNSSYTQKLVTILQEFGFNITTDPNFGAKYSITYSVEDFTVMNAGNPDGETVYGEMEVINIDQVNHEDWRDVNVYINSENSEKNQFNTYHAVEKDCVWRSFLNFDASSNQSVRSPEQ